MNVYALVHGRILDALKALQADGALPAGLDFRNVEVAPPRDAAHGDLASNAAMVLAKAAKMKPRDIADRLADKLKADPDIEKIEVAGPGSSIRLPAGILARRCRGHPEGGRRPMAASQARQPRRSTSNTCPPILPARCTSAIAAAPSSGMRWPTCWRSPATP